MKTILLVEDHPNLSALYQEELSAAGYCTLHACDGHEASKQMAQQHLDLVVLELNVPGMESLDQMLAGLPALPVIINSGRDDKTNKVRSWSAAAFVAKSSDLSELKLQIQQVLELQRKKENA